MEMEVGDAGPLRLGYYNTKQLLQQIRKRNMCHVRLTCTRIFWHARAVAHWREAKMRMRIPSKHNKHTKETLVAWEQE